MKLIKKGDYLALICEDGRVLRFDNPDDILQGTTILSFLNFVNDLDKYNYKNENDVFTFKEKLMRNFPEGLLNFNGEREIV